MSRLSFDLIQTLKSDEFVFLFASKMMKMFLNSERLITVFKNLKSR